MERRLNLVLCIIGLILFQSTALHAEECRLMRFPTTNSKNVVFSYAGDLYKVPVTGGEAIRLTSHIGYEMFARYSPDGKTIAFTGQYDGNTEVYTMDENGGKPERLTYTSTNSRDDIGDRMGPNNIVMCWSPDGESIIYRNRIGSGFEGKLWEVSPKGGMPEALPLTEGGFCCWSPDGKKLAYNRTFREFRTWKHYRGGQADDIWIYDGHKIINITDNPAQDIIPMWIGDEIYFVSDRDNRMNIFVYNTVSHKTDKVTDFTMYDVKFPSTDGKTIVFENGGYIYVLNPETKKYDKITILLNAEGIYARSELKKVSDKVTDASASSDRIAVTARGEIFTVPVKSGVTRNITQSPGANERCGTYSPDGKYIAYISDRTGETELFLYDTQSENTTQLTKDNDTYIRSILWSPDGTSVLYTDRKNRLVRISIPDGKKSVLLTCPEGEFRQISFSSDSKWITYTKPSTNEMDVVYIYNIKDGKEYPVTERWYNSSMPIFSSDSKYLFFNSDRTFNPIYSSVEWNHAFNRTGSIYMAILSETTPSPFMPTDGTDVAKDTTCQISTDNFFERIIAIPTETSSSYPIYSDGDGLWFGSHSEVSYFDFKTKQKTKIFDGSISTSDGKKALLKKDNKYQIVNMPKSEVKLDKPISLDDMYAPVEYDKEWAQIFDEAWRAFRDGFYLENMHGFDWKGIRGKYEVLLPHVKCRADLNYVIGEMIGELNVGHSYVSLGDYPKIEKVDMGLLGAEISAAGNGTFKIEHILTGAPYSSTLRSPLTERGMEIREGDYITAVDGISTKTVSNFYKLMVGKAERLTELTICSTPDGKDKRKVIVKPIKDEYPLYHYEWVRKNIEYVDKMSNGRIGYIFIPDMGPEGLKEFARYYYPQLDKEALIIDDRANGGGNVSPMIIERLARNPYRLSVARGKSIIGKIPTGTFYGPKVCLINKYSASDGDLFPWSFKANNLGELIGTRTWGGVVGISGSLPYMDGTDIRVPFFTFYDNKTGEWIIENHGVDPDIEVDNDPIKEQNGIDQQLDKAIEILLEKMKSVKKLPGVPAPRDFSKFGDAEKVQ